MRSKILSVLALAATLLGTAPSYSSEMTKAHLNKKVAPRVVKLNVNDERTVVLRGPVREDNTSAIVNQLKQLSLVSNDNMFLIINSPGGSVVDGFELINTLKAVQQRGGKVYCAVESEAYSMAAIIALYCYRTYMLKHSGIMFHEASYGVQGPASQISSRVNYMNKSLDDMHKDVSTQMGVTKEEYNELIDKEWWMTAEEAASLGIVDGVLETLFYTATPPEANPFKILFGLEKEPNVVINPLKAPDFGKEFDVR